MTRQELLPVMEATTHFDYYVYGVSTLVQTDPGALTSLLSFKNTGGQMSHWLGIIVEYNLITWHRPSRLYDSADALSRRPCNNYKHCESKEINHSEIKEVVRIRFMTNPVGDR